MTKEQFIKYMGIIHKRYDALEMLYYDLDVTDKDGNVLPSATYEDIWELIKGGDTN